jgi:hypothetical protein
MEQLNVVVKEALNGDRGDDQLRIAQVGLDWIETILKKNQNYGSSVWETPVLAPNMDVASAILVRMSDKVSRLQSLTMGDIDAVGESLEDTIRDLGAYCLLYLARPQGDENELVSGWLYVDGCECGYCREERERREQEAAEKEPSSTKQFIIAADGKKAGTCKDGGEPCTIEWREECSNFVPEYTLVQG